MLSLFRVFMVVFALCFRYGAFADEIDDIIKAANAMDNLESVAVFEDVKYLNDLINTLNWANSANQERRDLYQKLSSIVKEIETLENMSLEERLQQNIDDVQAEYDAARENEQSTVNKMLGGASMAAMGIAGMELASAISEKNTMEDAEQQMKAYLATFMCDWVDGNRVRGGEMAIELPGGNDLLPLITEYKSLAADLKARKESLGLRSGIESEEILDKSISGLYDDETFGGTDGVFTSLSRALSDKNSEDAVEWTADKEKTDKTIKNATTAVAVAAVASVAANLAINGSNRNAVVGKAESVRDDAYHVLDAIIQNCNDALIAQKKLDKIIIGYDNLSKLGDYAECED